MIWLIKLPCVKAYEEVCRNIVKTVHQHMDEAGIKAQVDGRIKHFSASIKDGKSGQDD